MGTLIKFDIKEMPDVMVMGKELRHSMKEQMEGNNPLPGFWERCFADGTFSALEAQKGCVYDDSYVGVMLDWDRGDGNFSYVIGMLMNRNAELPQGYAGYKLDATKAAVGWVQGKDTADVCSNAHELTERALKEKGYKCDAMKWSMELYNCPRFTTPDGNGDIILDYYIPLD
ncbi:MAG: GyrI-like domain-containing protein [Clostridiales bacterium]|jgi:predicted transcriptional regulator YdeE|nr:GyrI-like domain-containing protein [Clostridiales bacterium]